MIKQSAFVVANLLVASGAFGQGAPPPRTPPAGSRPPIPFGSALNSEKQRAESQKLASSLAVPGIPGWHAKGDQHRTYRFPDAGVELPYRLYVPTNWDGKTELPLVMMLHGGNADESRYMDQNDQQIIRLAEQHGYLLVSPLGYSPTGAYGTPLKLPAVFGQPEVAAQQRASLDDEKSRILEFSEKDTINVLELVMKEYPIDRSSVFLTGHSMGSGGTWYLGAKYSQYWRAIAPMSGPFVDEGNYPWENLRNMPIFMSEGTLAYASTAGSRAMRDWIINHGFNFQYLEVKANHHDMVEMALPPVFDFFDRYRKHANITK